MDMRSNSGTPKRGAFSCLIVPRVALAMLAYPGLSADTLFEGAFRNYSKIKKSPKTTLEEGGGI